MIPRLGRSPGGGHGNPLQHSCLETPTERGAWPATVHVVAKIRTQLSDFHFTSLPSRLTACSSVAGGGPRLVRKWGKAGLRGLALDPPMWVLPARSSARVPHPHSCPQASHCPCALLGIPGHHAPAPGTGRLLLGFVLRTPTLSVTRRVNGGSPGMLSETSGRRSHCRRETRAHRR